MTSKPIADIIQLLTQRSESPDILVHRQRIEAAIKRLAEQIQLLKSEDIWNEFRMEHYAVAVDVFTFFAKDKDNYDLASYLYRPDATPWTEAQIQEGLPFTPENWSAGHWNFIYKWARPWAPEWLPKDWVLLPQLWSYKQQQLTGQPLLDATSGGDYYSQIGPKRALGAKRKDVAGAMLRCGYIDNQTLLEGNEDDYLQAFYRFKKAIKNAMDYNSRTRTKCSLKDIDVEAELALLGE